MDYEDPDAGSIPPAAAREHRNDAGPMGFTGTAGKSDTTAAGLATLGNEGLQDGQWCRCCREPGIRRPPRQRG